MAKRNSYDIVGDAVKEYWCKNFPQDVVVFFEQKYEYDTCWERMEELVESWSDSDYDNMTFLNDFCEGQTDVIIHSIVPLHEVLLLYAEGRVKWNG